MKKLFLRFLATLTAAAVTLGTVVPANAETLTDCVCDLCDECGKCLDKDYDCDYCPGACPGHVVYVYECDCRLCDDCFEPLGWIRGDVNGDGVINNADVLEILLFLGGNGNVIDGGVNGDIEIIEGALQRSLITEEAYDEYEPNIGDVLEILGYLAGLDNLLGENKDGIPLSVSRARNVKVIYDKKEQQINFKMSGRFPKGERVDGTAIITYSDSMKIRHEFHYDYKENYAAIKEYNSTTGRFYAAGSGVKDGDVFLSIELYGYGTITIKGESGTFKHIPETVIYIRRPGDVNDDGEITIDDALEILKFLADLESVVQKDEKYKIDDVLEILKHLAGLKSWINWIN